ncbi:64_t:CDS:2 [Funneliformis caledonium]|uniref:64_t:CDS:1 n=1 Tax=Funneliformis caledonium TaxID=1117310 RepID=A0A9N8VMG7_9GLOM|nr:64_t:CDS:2 [Funneliformis caledonium]
MNYDYHPVSIFDEDETTLKVEEGSSTTIKPIPLEATEQEYIKNKSQSSFNRLFLRRFHRILRILFSPSNPDGNVMMIWSSLICLSLLNEILVYFAGTVPSRFYTVLIGKDFNNFKPLMIYSIAIILSAGFCKSVVKFIGGLFALSTRNILTKTLQSKYVNKSSFYRLLTSRTDVDNPDQRITQDVDKFSETFREICQETIITPFLIIYYTYKTSSLTGYLGPVLIYSYFVLGIIASRFLINPLVNLVYVKEFHEGNFRFLHVRIRQFSESIAFSLGEKFELYRLDSFFKNILKYQRKIIDRELYLDVLTESFSYFGSIFSYLIIAIPVFTGEYDGIEKDKLGGIISMNSFLSLYLIYRFTVIVKQSTNVSDLAGYTARIGQLLEAIEDISNNTDDVDPDYPFEYRPGTELSIEFSHVSFASPTGTPLLSDFKFTIEQEKNVIIMGPNGSGKTSLLRVMCGLWPTTKGQIEHQKQINHKYLIYLPQTPYLVFGSLLESFDSKYGIDWNKMLSPGEQQKLAFARLFFWEPTFAALDEATSSLDSETEKLFFDKCKALGITTITVSHNKDLLQYHDKVLLLDGKGGYLTSDIDINGTENIVRWIDSTLRPLS